MSELLHLGSKRANLEELVAQAMKNEKALLGLLWGISPDSKRTQVRFNSFKALMLLSERHPEALLPCREFIVDLLKSDNSYSKFAAAHIIAALAAARKKVWFEGVFDIFYDLLDDRSVAVAAHVAGVSGKIARANPKLRERITERLLAIDKTNLPSERKDLVMGYAIESFGEYIEEARGKEKIIEFVRKQLTSRSPTTRKKAAQFLKKFA